MATSGKIGWRHAARVILPPTTSTAPQLTIAFATAAEAQAAVLTPTKLKYGKGACFMYDHDDCGLDFFTNLFPFFSPLTYSDGAGGTVNYRATGAINGHDGNGNELCNGGNSNKYTWANMVAMARTGCDFANHSDLHTDVNPGQQVDTLQALAKTRFAALGYPYVLRCGIVPTNYGDYVPEFIRVGFPRGTISSQGSSGGYPLLPLYNENLTIPFSDLPTSGPFVLRRSLTDAGTTPLTTEQSIIDDLVTGTEAAPKIFRCFSHSEVAGVTDNIFTYVHGKADVVWVPTLREFGEYLETAAGTIITKTVSGTNATWTLNQSALAADVRWRDMSFRVSGGTPTTASISSAKGYTRSGTLINVYNSDVVPTGITAATVVLTPGGLLPTAGPKVDLAYDYSLASATSNQDESGYATLFDYTATKPAPSFGFNWLHAGSVMRFPFRPQTLTRLDEIAWVDGAGDAASNNNSPIAIWYKAVGSAAVQVGSFAGAQYDENAYQPAIAVPVGGVAEWVEFRFVEKNATFPNRLRFRGAQTAYTVPQYDAVAEQIRFGSGVNSDLYDYVQSNASLAGYGAVDETKLAQMRRFGRRNRQYLDVNSMLRPSTSDVQATGPIERRINTEFHGFLFDDILGRLHAAGDSPLVSVINARARTAATWPLYVNQHPYVAAYIDGGGVAHPEVPAQPWLNDTNTCTPRVYGSDPLNPASFTEAAKDLAELQLRYGNGTTTNPAASTFSTTKQNSYDAAAPVIKLNLGYVRGFGFLNENNESYRGIQQYMPPAELLTATSAVFDGAKGTLGAGVGLRSYDPTAELALMPTSYPLPHYFMGIVEQARATRGLLPSGYVDLPFTAADVHYYPTELTTNQNGVPYQVAPSRPQMKQLRQLVREFGGPLMKCRWSESGYISDPTAIDGVTYLPGRSYAPPSASYTSDQRIAHWNVQNILCGIADGFDGIQLYAANDIRARGIGANWDQVGRLKDMPTEFHLGQVNQLLDGYIFAGWLQNADGVAGTASIQKWSKAGQPDIYAVWAPGKAESTVAFTLSLPGATQVGRYAPQDTGNSLAQTTVSIGGSYSGTATEAPVFYQAS